MDLKAIARTVVIDRLIALENAAAHAVAVVAERRAEQLQDLHCAVAG